MADTSIREASRLTYEHIQTTGALDPTQWRAYDYLFHHGPCTPSEVNKALNKGKPRGKGRTAYQRCLKGLAASGCVAEVGAKVTGTGKTVPMYDVTSRPPDHAKLVAAQPATKPRSARPSKPILTTAVVELLALCREQRDQHGKVFSPEFKVMCRWLKTLAAPPTAVPPKTG